MTHLQQHHHHAPAVAHARHAIADACTAATAPAAATVALWAAPLAGEPALTWQVPAGVTIASTLPDDLAGEVVVCRYQGLWVLREQWPRLLMSGDLVEWHVRPQGGGGGSNPLRTILSIALVFAAFTYGAALGGWVGKLFGASLSSAQATALGATLIQVGGSLALNAVLPMAQASAGGAGPQASPSYNVALQGNQPRLEGAIPVLYGFNRTYPDFGGKPYSTFDNDTSDQYYHALLVLAHGHYTVPRLDIDDTPLGNFDGVEYNILPPGTAPTLVSPAVVTAPEVTGQELLPGRYLGPYAAHAPELQASEVAFDLALPGLGVVNNDGSVSAKSVTVRFEARPVDYIGRTTGPWLTLGTVDISAATADTVRRSYSYTLATAGRYVYRTVRTSPKDENRQVLNSIAWVGLRTTLTTAAPLEPSVTHIELRIRATEQLNSLTERRVAVTSLRKLPVWTPSAPGATTGTWSADVETRNPAWAIADAMRNAVYGDGLPDNRIDLAGLYALAQVWEARQDRCDVVFDTFSDSESIGQMLAGTGRAVVVPRGGSGVYTVVRDQLAGLPVTAYSAGTMRPGSWSQEYGTPTSDSPDGVIVEYWSNRAWDWLSIECPAPGRTYTDEAHPAYNPALPKMARPVRERLLAITGAKHAEREGLYRAAKLVYRRNVATWATELQGVLAAAGSAVRVAPPLPSWSRSGEVVSWDADARTIVLTEPHGITSGTTYTICLQRDVGTWTAPITVTAGADAYTAVLASVPDTTLVTDAGWRERPKYLLGTVAQQQRLARVVAIEPGGVDDQGAPVINMTAVIDDARVHSADEALLPAEAEVQDEISLDAVDDDEDSGGTLLLTSLSDREVAARFLGSASASYSLMADGRARQSTTPGGDAYIGSEWLLIAPTSTADTGLFEARATVTSGTLTSGTVDTWLPLSTTRTWTLTNTTEETTATVLMDIEIRDTETDTVQSTCSVTLRATADLSPGGE